MTTYAEHRKEVAVYTRTYVLTLLAEYGGNISLSAKAAGLHRNTFSRILDDCGVTVADVRRIRTDEARKKLDLRSIDQERDNGATYQQ